MIVCDHARSRVVVRGHDGREGSCVVVCDRVRPCVVVVVVSESSEAVVCGCEQSLIIRAHLKYFFSAISNLQSRSPISAPAVDARRADLRSVFSISNLHL